MPDVNAGFAMTLPPVRAIAYFQSKGLTPTMSWKEMQDEAHAVEFTVAGITKLDVLSDIQNGLTRSLTEGKTFSQFRDGLEPLLQRKGWLGRGLVADEDGVLTGKKLMPWRLDTIFRTNIQSAYASSRYTWMVANVKDRPYWQYNALMDGRTRPAHAALDGRIFRWDDPIWNVLFPPNGYNCRCFVRAFTQAQVDAHPVGVESSEAYLVTIQQPYGTDGETRPVTAFRDPKTGQVLVPDAGFNLNPGRGYLAGLGQSLLEKSAVAPPELAARAVHETLRSNRLASAMNRNLDVWVRSLPARPGGDFRRAGALSPLVLAAVSDGATLPSPVITLPAATAVSLREAGTSWLGRLASAFRYPVAVLQRGETLLMVVEDLSGHSVVTLVRHADGWEPVSSEPWSRAAVARARLIDGELPEDA
ncbi:phage head morphogenesis protein [Erwinia psidii]|uniref:phage head morphogenesis protein n=1 Tax=Erwinia psidii TaxID=69224 RepID=UPI00226B97C4|nr:phage minor head protein [Erwinia psidii]MCX8957217.1 phage head morphogenesis protein [Erwinia psidii]